MSDLAETIAVVDDDVYINDMLCTLLKREGYSVLRAFSGGEALAVLSENTPDLVLLDLMMPGLSGEQVLPKIRNIPVIVMSARADVDSKVSLLLGGAEDYITKPFDTEELLARIKVRLRKNNSGGVLEHGGLVLELDTHEARYGESSARLTRTEFAILKILMQNPKQVITKSQMLDRVSEDTPDCVESSLKVHISNLRKKLREISDKEHIESVWGIGFKMAGGSAP